MDAPSAPLDPSRLRRILVVQMGAFGDVIQITPCLRALRRAAPAARISVAVKQAWAPVFRSDPDVAEVIESRSRRGGFLSGLLEGSLRLPRDERFDLALDLQGRRRSAGWVYASRAHLLAGRGRRRPGWRTTGSRDAASTRHAVEAAAAVLDDLGIPVTDLRTDVHVSRDADEALVARLAANGIPPSGFLVVNPFTGWRSKEWPAERWAELIRRLHAEEPRRPIVVSGAPGEEPRAVDLLGVDGALPARSLVGHLSLAEALCLYRRAALMVSGDTGPMHAAVALGTPVVALFGPTWPERSGPRGPGDRVIQAHRPPSHHAFRSDDAGEYMRAIDVETVVAAVRESLAGAPALATRDG